MVIINSTREVPRGAVANMLYWDNVLSEFDLQSQYYIHFRINIYVKVQLLFCSDGFGIW